MVEIKSSAILRWTNRLVVEVKQRKCGGGSGGAGGGGKTTEMWWFWWWFENSGNVVMVVGGGGERGCEKLLFLVERATFTSSSLNMRDLRAMNQ